MQAYNDFEVADGILVNYTGNQEHIDLPLGIRAIGKRAFAGCTGVREVALGPEVDAIGDEAFVGCTSLERVLIVCTTLNIGCGAFASCTSLQTLTMEGSYFHASNEAFKGCTSLRELDFSEVGWVDLGERVFAGCTGLTRVASRGCSLTIGKQAFLGCTALECIECNDDTGDDWSMYLCTEEVDVEAFAGCTALEQVRIDQLQRLGQGAFKDCTSLTEVELHDSNVVMLELGSGVFAGCTSLASVRLPKPREFEDARDMFRGCTSLTHADLGNVDFSKVRHADGMFAGCTSLEELDLSDVDTASLTSAEGMFDGCTSLVRWKIPAAWPVELPGAVPTPPTGPEGSWWSERARTWLTVAQIVARGPIADGFTSCSPQEMMTLVGAEVEDGVLLGYYGSRSTVIVTEAVSAIGDGAFRNCDTLESIVLPCTLERIGVEAFAGCSALRKVEFADDNGIGDCPLKIGRRAFAGCRALAEIELPSTMHEELGDYLFEGCTSLVSATLPAVGGYGVFKGCTRLHEVTVGGVTFFASDWDEDYLSYVVMAARFDAIDIRNGVIFDFTSPAKSTIYEWEADQARHGERKFGCAVLPEGYRCTTYLGRCSCIAIIPKDVRVHSIAPKAFPGISNLVAFVAPEGLVKVGWRAFPAMKDRSFLKQGRPHDVNPDGW